ncbi:MAG: hypothetical protein WCW27_04960 [Patescibacteria group bacterium]|jgi:hypothetical protein
MKLSHALMIVVSFLFAVIFGGCTEDPCARKVQMLRLQAAIEGRIPTPQELLAAEEDCATDLYTEADEIMGVPILDDLSVFFYWDEPGTPRPDVGSGQVVEMDEYNSYFEYSGLLYCSENPTSLRVYVEAPTLYVNFWTGGWDEEVAVYSENAAMYSEMEGWYTVEWEWSDEYIKEHEGERIYVTVEFVNYVNDGLLATGVTQIDAFPFMDGSTYKVAFANEYTLVGWYDEAPLITGDCESYLKSNY